MRTVFGISESIYRKIRNEGTPEENEALDILECEWAIEQERKENSILKNVPDRDQSRKNDWVNDPQ